MISGSSTNFPKTAFGKSGKCGKRRGEFVSSVFSLPPIGRRENTEENSPRPAERCLGILGEQVFRPEPKNLLRSLDSQVDVLVCGSAPGTSIREPTHFQRLRVYGARYVYNPPVARPTKYSEALSAQNKNLLTHILE